MEMSQLWKAVTGSDFEIQVLGGEDEVWNRSLRNEELEVLLVQTDTHEENGASQDACPATREAQAEQANHGC